MKKLNYLVLISGLILSSCVKEKLAREPTVQNPFADELETMHISLEGFSHATGRDFQGNIMLYDDLKSFVTISDAHETLPFIIRNDKSFDISNVTITDQGAGRYQLHHVLNTEPKVVLSSLKSEDYTVSGEMKIDETNVKISFTSELFSENTIRNGKLPLEEEGYSRAIPILVPAIIGGIVVTGTAIHCAYERTTARRHCSQQYDKCWTHCPNQCNYKYSAGICGGNCEVSCP